MKKVLLVSETIESYRIPLFNEIAAEIDFTVSHVDGFSDDVLFNTLKIDSKKYGPFTFYTSINYSQFDIVIFPFNLRVLNLLTFLIKKPRFTVGLFGIGVAASYSKTYDEKSFILDKLRLLILKSCDFAIFYEQYPFIKYKSLGIDPEKMTIAYNTVQKNEAFDIAKKTFESFLFIGKLYKEKKVFDLLNAYHLLLKNNQFVPNLEIVGAGDEYQSIKDFIRINRLEQKVLLHGEVIDDQELLPIMQRSIVCVSPGQAGLSVQKSFSYGVGFITTSHAITGGELFSIISGVNGDFYDGSIEGLEMILSQYLNKEYCYNISNNAYDFYSRFRNTEIWKQGFLKNIL